MPALQLAVGGGVDRDSQRPRERVSAEFKEGYLRRAVLLFYAERVVLLLRHAFSSLTGRPVITPSAGRSAPTRGILDEEDTRPVSPGSKALRRHPRVRLRGNTRAGETV